MNNNNQNDKRGRQDKEDAMGAQDILEGTQATGSTQQKEANDTSSEVRDEN